MEFLAFSIVISVKNAKFYRGVFPADKGGRLSSVIDVNTKEGNPNKLSGSINLGILTSRIALNGPLFNKKTTFSLAFRRSIFDYIGSTIVSID